MPREVRVIVSGDDPQRLWASIYFNILTPSLFRVVTTRLDPVAGGIELLQFSESGALQFGPQDVNLGHFIRTRCTNLKKLIIHDNECTLLPHLVEAVKCETLETFKFSCRGDADSSVQPETVEQLREAFRGHPHLETIVLSFTPDMVLRIMHGVHETMPRLRTLELSHSNALITDRGALLSFIRGSQALGRRTTLDIWLLNVTPPIRHLFATAATLSPMFTVTSSMVFISHRMQTDFGQIATLGNNIARFHAMISVPDSQPNPPPVSRLLRNDGDLAIQRRVLSYLLIAEDTDSESDE